MANKSKILISDYVKERRKAEGLTIRDFAMRYNVSKSQIEKYERGAYDIPSVSSSKSFCRTFGVTYDEFIADFNINDNQRIILNLGAVAQISKRNKDEMNSEFPGKVSLSFFEQQYKLGILKDYKLLDWLHDEDNVADNTYIYKNIECLNNNDEKVFISYFLRPIQIPNIPKHKSYDYLAKIISFVSCFTDEEIGGKNFIFITPSKDEYNYFAAKKYNECVNSVLLVYVKGFDNFEESKLLFGKEFLF